ncbi:unnamed protein product [Parascedosporium putredinis]|uniref:Uncharacterized protein n=1 Tax=Parascedosporium putredinis TaxID=1442378 RepID=A0A9P1MCJ8_9PEZI|nr:unnamed protein product [Parascedosporium putredinis]CAI8001782.1 unnamed protein product [Parascedosporium putredinis]
MSLAQLAPEVLVDIIAHLGPDFFHRDIRRLTLYKRWYQTAWQVFVRDVRLSSGSLGKLLRPGVHPHPSAAAVLDGLALYTREVSIDLCGFQDWEAARHPAYDVLHAHNKADGRAPDHAAHKLSSYKTERIDEWTAQLNESIGALAAAMRGWRRLHSVKITGNLELSPVRPRTIRSYLTTGPLTRLFSLAQLTSLTSTSPAPRSLGKFQRYGFDVVNAERCHHAPPTELAAERAMEIQAANLAERLTLPRMVRVIYRSNVYSNTVAIDVLTGARSILPKFLPWDAEDDSVTDLFHAGRRRIQQRLIDEFETGQDFLIIRMTTSFFEDSDKCVRRTSHPHYHYHPFTSTPGSSRPLTTHDDGPL